MLPSKYVTIIVTMKYVINYIYGDWNPLRFNSYPNRQANQREVSRHHPWDGEFARVWIYTGVNRCRRGWHKLGSFKSRVSSYQNLLSRKSCFASDKFSAFILQSTLYFFRIIRLYRSFIINIGNSSILFLMQQ